MAVTGSACQACKRTLLISDILSQPTQPDGLLLQLPGSVLQLPGLVHLLAGLRDEVVCLLLVLPGRRLAVARLSLVLSLRNI